MAGCPEQELAFCREGNMESPVARREQPPRRLRPPVSLLALLLAAAVFYFWRLPGVPLVEPDEPAYARMVMAALQSGQWFDFTLEGQPMLSRPPLYLWLAMGSVALLGEHELAFRLPSVLLGILGIALVWSITYRLSRSKGTAGLAGLVLLVSPMMYGFTREVRLDTGVISAMLAALLGVVMGWRQPRWLVVVWPSLAVGFLFKNVAIALAVPIIAVYSVAYYQWQWLRSRNFWVGGIWAAAFALPWPVWQYLRHGNRFLQSFFVHDVWLRAVEGFGNRPRGVIDYLLVLWEFNQPWTALLLLLVVWLGISAFTPLRRRLPWPRICAPLGAAFAVVVLFTAVRTRIPTYVLPAVPFGAMFVAEVLVQLTGVLHPRRRLALAVTVIVLLVFGAWHSRRIAGQLVNPFHYDQREVGRLLRVGRDPDAPLYLVNWPYHGAIRYYGAIDLVSLKLPEASGQVITAPFYLVLGPTVDPTFGHPGDPEIARRGLRVLFSGPYLRLFYGQSNLQLPYPQAE